MSTLNATTVNCRNVNASGVITTTGELALPNYCLLYTSDAADEG